MGEALNKFRRENSGKPPMQGPPTPLGTICIKSLQRFARPGSQRRCYNGCFPSSDWEMIWSDWEVFLSNRPEEDLAFWQDLNKNKKYKWEMNSYE